ncbi:DUF2336 domain-containing protein [Parvularcula lutaonensis]|uniref:DUF2336 domain-containing protein n=1 Tax=Parvularcula lutaonensis TaxID=491923 RepID=A0ABV7M8Q4_9PROT|nr:DUF2336 domain-containing protein [Parvularcula lutaonensis]GGY45162.1 hypothetical protein GCM10007148_12660 [Parvularcula lutaonensis]
MIENSTGDEVVDRNAEQLLNAVSQLLVSTRRHQTRSDRQYANELVGRIIDAMSLESKIKAADILSRMSEPPEDLIRKLGLASPETARVILLGRHVTDAVLMEAASKSFELREIIAQRPQLSEPVVNRLLFYEESKIENMILPRSECPISNSRAARLINRVEDGSTLGWMLSKRTDLSPRLSLRLFWRVEGDSRQAILSRFKVDPSLAAEVFTRVFKTEQDAFSSTPLGKLAQLVSEARESENGPLKDAPGPQLTDELTAFRTNANTAAIQTVSDAAKISFELGRKIAEDVPGDAFTILCTALGVKDKAFGKMMAIRPRKGAGSAPYTNEDKDRSIALFDRISRSAAIGILSYWEIDLIEDIKARAREQLDMDLNAIKERLSSEFDQETDEEAEARTEAEKAAATSKKRRFGIF